MEDATLSPSVSPSSLLFVLQLQPVSVARGSPILFCQHPCHHVPRVKLSPPQRTYLAQENLQQHPCSLCLKQTRAKPDVCSPAAIFALSPLPYPRRGFGSRPDLSTLAQPQEDFLQLGGVGMCCTLWQSHISAWGPAANQALHSGTTAQLRPQRPYWVPQ